MTNQRLVITLPWPAATLSPNARPHWAAKHRATQHARLAAKLFAMDAMRRQGWKGRVTNARASLTFFHRKDGRRRDGDNHLAMCKAYFDGVADAGVIADDSGFTHSPPKFVPDGKKRVELVIESTE
jgi:crossover junction endodeoxyribonuclease RusA